MAPPTCPPRRSFVASDARRRGQVSEASHTEIQTALAAIRMGPWKFHFSTREDYYGNLTGRTAPLVFNLRSDPFESYDNKDSFGHLAQRMSWMFQPMSELMTEHLKTLEQYPPVQGGTSFDMSNVVQEFLHRSGQ